MRADTRVRAMGATKSDRTRSVQAKRRSVELRAIRQFKAGRS